MPDIATTYALATPIGTIYFNDTGQRDQFYLQNIQGLAGAPIAAPIDGLAYTDGSISYNFWKRGRHIIFEGMFLVTSVPPCPSAVEIWNVMEDELREALDSISGLQADTAILSWTPSGQTSVRSLVVRNDVPLEVQPDQDYLVRTFTFGLFSDDPAWTESP